ncbi:mCG145485, partial [Mus musculus]
LSVKPLCTCAHWLFTQIYRWWPAVAGAILSWRMWLPTPRSYRYCLNSGKCIWEASLPCPQCFHVVTHHLWLLHSLNPSFHMIPKPLKLGEYTGIYVLLYRKG